MNTQLSSKLAALAVALVMNTVIIGGVAHLFDVPSRAHTAMLLSAQTVQTARVAT
jgi:hypothetical protein